MPTGRCVSKRIIMQLDRQYHDMTNYYHREDLYQYIMDDTVWYSSTVYVMLSSTLCRNLNVELKHRITTEHFI